MPPAKFIYPSDPKKKILGPRMNIICLFVHSRFFRVAFCLFLYLNDSFRVRKKGGGGVIHDHVKIKRLYQRKNG